MILFSAVFFFFLFEILHTFFLTGLLFWAAATHSHQVHKSSTDAASSLLVTALNEGRDVILDGTLSWEPYVEQTIAMARAVHRQRYRMGVGYHKADDGTVTERYWEPDAADGTDVICRKPYRIEIVGVVCDAYLAVARGIRRAIVTRRAVRVRSQLQSHKRFAAAFQRYSRLVDGARLYSTNSLGSAQVITHPHLRSTYIHIYIYHICTCVMMMMMMKSSLLTSIGSHVCS